MELTYFATSGGNFGDDLNLWLWDDLLPSWRDWKAPGHLVGVGTVLNSDLLPNGPKLVLGSGVGYGRRPDLSQGGPWDVRMVRGPRTALALGLPPERAVCDPAVMLPRLPRFADIPRGAPRGNETLFVPHFLSADGQDWPTLCRRAGVAYQGPGDDAEEVIRRIAGAGRVIAESMHAAIVADAFGVPWTPVAVSPLFNGFKWGDWSESLGMALPRVPIFYAPLRRAQSALRQVRGTPRPAAAGPERMDKADAVSPTEGGYGRRARSSGPVAGGRVLRLLAPLTVRHLRHAAAGHFYLTDRTRLALQQDRIEEILAGVTKDYAG